MTGKRTGGRTAQDGSPSLEQKVAFLRSAASHRGVEEVEVKETRMAWVFLAGDHVYKMKKPVRYPYLDYSTTEKRRRICETELGLNRRLAPDVYQRVASLTAEAGGLAIDGSGEVVDWMVVMHRLPRNRFLETAIEAASVTSAHITRVADRLTAFYRDLPPQEIDPQARVETLFGEIDKGVDVLGEAECGATAARGRAALARLRAVLERDPGIVTERITAGQIVEGHGDLRPEHVCLTDPPVMIDCLEFSRDLRLVDPFDELAFLAMECAALGAPWIGPLLIGRCADALAENRPTVAQLAFYTAYRATLRARQSLEHLLEPEPRDPEKWQPKARRYLAEAERALTVLGPCARRGAQPVSLPSRSSTSEPFA